MSEALFTTRPRRRRTSRRVWRVLSIVLILVGTLALIDAGVTLVWQEPFSALYAKFRQDHLNGTLRAVERATPTPVERRALASLPDERRRVAFLASELQRHAGDGSAVGRIVIPRIDASYVVVKGTDTSDLESGPGIYSETNFPGVAGTTAIAGHRTTYLAPFRDINELQPRQPHPARHALRPLHLHGDRPAGGACRQTCPPPCRASATRAWCCPPARLCSAPKNGCSCTPA